MKWRALALLSLAELLAMSVWFTASAIGPELQARWSLSGSEVGWLTTAVQLGFVLGTAVAALSNLADIIPSKVFFAATALLAAGANGAAPVARMRQAAMKSDRLCIYSAPICSS